MKPAAGALMMILAWTGMAEAAAFRGYLEINRVMRQRLFRPDSSFQLGQYLGESYSETGSNLLDLLGTYKGDGLDSSFKNGTANSANMLIWHFLLASFARDVSR
jgi:hypothetical protein